MNYRNLWNLFIHELHEFLYTNYKNNPGKKKQRLKANRCHINDNLMQDYSPLIVFVSYKSHYIAKLLGNRTHRKSLKTGGDGAKVNGSVIIEPESIYYFMQVVDGYRCPVPSVYIDI